MHKETALVNDEGRVLLASGLSSTSITKPSAQRAFFMNAPLNYTPLESLLLFQALRYEGVALANFKRISEQLKNVPLVRNDPTYNEARLSADALQNLYLRLLKEEARNESAQRSDQSTSEPQNSHATSNGNGDVAADSRKRKAPSPSFPTVQEAAQHAHLIPMLVSRLYARYRDTLIRTLREHERRYTSLSREVVEIKTGQWDDRLQRERALATKDSTTKGHASHVPTATVDPTKSANNVTGVAANRPADQKSQIPASLNSRTKSDAGLQVTSQTIAPRPGGAPAFGHPTTTPTSHNSPSVITQGKSATLPGPPQIQPMPPGLNRGSQPLPSPGSQSPYATSHSHPRPSPVPKVQIQPSHPKTVPQASRASVPHQISSPGQRSASPNITAPSHVHSSQPYAQQQQARAAIAPGDTRQGSHPATPTHQYPQGYHPPNLSQDLRIPFPQPAASAASSHVNQPQSTGGYMLPPFQLQAQGHASQAQTHISTPQSQPSRAQHQQSGPPLRTQLPIGQLPPAPATAPRLQASSRQISSIVSALATPIRNKTKPLWKTDVRPYSNAKPTLQMRPEVEPLSPTLERKQTHVNSSRTTHDPINLSDDVRNQLVPIVKNTPGRKRASTRDKSPQSTASVSVDDHGRAATRSQSVVPDSVSASQEDRPISRDGVKLEPSTPAASGIDDDDPMPAPSTTSAGAPLTRTRRGTLSSSHHGRPVKRKRQETPSDIAEDHAQSPSPAPVGRSRKVLATRNFAKMSSTIMNDIDSHKHASYFKTAVRERDAPGYHEIILQPQHLKSIRSAITAGTRAVAAAATATAPDDIATPTLTRKNSIGGAALGAPGTPTESGLATVELERTEDLEPPKAIVNGTQLEKEVMRMLANAYLFNPGDDGMAEITREMFMDVERQMQAWRGTERFLGGAAGDEQRHRLSLDHSAPTSSVGAGSDGKMGGSVKRRKA